MEKIYIKQINKKDRGVFAKAKIKKGEVIEVAPVIIVPSKHKKLLDKTHLFHYYFNSNSKGRPLIVLGFGSLYNHSYEPNADYMDDAKKQTMTYKALRTIKKGEEIRINYNGEPHDNDDVWFKVKF